MSIHHKHDKFWIVLDDDGSSVTYGHQLDNRVILRIVGVQKGSIESVTIIPDSEIVEQGEGFTLVGHSYGRVIDS